LGQGVAHLYEMTLAGVNQYAVNPITSAELILPDGGRVHYDRISPGTDLNTAVLEHTGSPSVFYKSRAGVGRDHDPVVSDPQGRHSL